MNWMPKRDSLTHPVYRSLADAIARAVARGELPPGSRLPSQRELADRLGLSVQTVGRALEELARRGLVRGHVGRGTWITGGADEPQPPFVPDRRAGNLLDLSMLKPVAGEWHRELAREAFAHLAQTADDTLLFSFRPQVALARHRGALADWLAQQGLVTTPEHVIATNGATPAITAALLAAVRPGEKLATEAVAYHTLIPLARYLGIELVPLPLDEEGALPEALAEAARDPALRAVFLLPTGGGPTCSCMGVSRREAIVEIARRHDLLLVENDALRPLFAGAPPPLAALAPERTFHIQTLTKSLWPGLRAGCLVAPDRALTAAANRHLVTSWMATPMVAEIAARLIGDGTAARLVEWQRDALARRQRLAADMLDGSGFRALPTAPHLWLPLPEPWSDQAFVAQARLQGVAVAPGSAFAVRPDDPPRAVRLCLGGVSEDDLVRALTVVRRLLGEEPEPPLLTL